MQKLFLLSILVVIGISFSIIPSTDPPFWGEQFSISFHQYGQNYSEIINGLYKTNYKFNHSRTDRSSGKYDPLCASMMPNVTTPCTHLVNNGTKFVVYPEKSLCCECCHISDSKCFFIQQNWLQNATYKGVKSVSWQFYNWWQSEINGVVYDYWSTMDDIGYPRKLTNYTLNISMDFNPYSYNDTAIPDEVFKVPNYCNNKCPSSSYCN